MNRLAFIQILLGIPFILEGELLDGSFRLRAIQHELESRSELMRINMDADLEDMTSIFVLCTPPNSKSYKIPYIMVGSRSVCFTKPFHKTGIWMFQVKMESKDCVFNSSILKVIV